MMNKSSLFYLLVLLLIMAAEGKAQGLPEEGPYLFLKEQAFTVLKNNCNNCHQKMNPKKVFSLENMESFAAEIEEQAIIKKRMPLGFWNKLEEEELNHLKTWIKSYKKSK